MALEELSKTSRPPALAVAPPPAQVSAPLTRRRAKSPRTRKMTFSLENETAERLAIHAARQRKTPGKAVNEILLPFLRRYGAGRQLFDLAEEVAAEVAAAGTAPPPPAIPRTKQSA